MLPFLTVSKQTIYLSEQFRSIPGGLISDTDRLKYLRWINIEDPGDDPGVGDEESMREYNMIVG